MPQQPSEIAVSELFTRLGQDAGRDIAVVTPNRRLARALERDYDRLRAAGGRAAWETADVLPLGALVARMWEDTLYSDRGAKLPLLLTPAQEQAAWDEAVRSAHSHDPVFSAPAAAAQCREAWMLAHAWRIDARRAGPANEDVEAWLEWSVRYERATRGQTDAARLPDVVARGLDLGSRKPATVAVAGFDIVTPQARDFLDALAAAGTEIVRVAAPSHAARVARVELTHPRDEIAAAARWARARLAPSALGEGQPRIGIVVPDLARSRARVQRVFTETLAPSRAITPGEAPLPFDISLGIALADVPLVGDALLLLALAGPQVAFEEASRLVRSPFVGGARTEMEVRARLDARLRERSGPSVTLDQVVRLAAASTGARAPLLLDRLAALAAARKASLFGAKSAADWAKAFSDALRAAGFPGERTLDSAEHQALERWHELLGEFASLERVTTKMGFGDACARLGRMAREAIFQPEAAPEVAIQVLGVLESAGQEFDHLWVMGLTDDAWPLPVRPNPFLPLRAQRAAGVPQADSVASLELDRRLTAGWMRAAPEVIFSHARAQGESELAPSPLIAAIPRVDFEALGIAQFASLREAIRRGGRIDTIEDARAPAIAVPQHRGGTGLFRDQAACPFRGYAHRRVASKPLETPRVGLDPRDRGNLLHAMLAEVWKALASRAGLMARQAELPAILERAAIAAIADVKKKRGDALRGRFERMEHARLVRLAREWLSREEARPDFEVVAIEDKRPLTFGGVTVEARLDRMDLLATGRAIIDYKTGACATGDLLGDRPDEPQLPMYALASGMDIAAVAFGQVRAGEMRFRGLSREAKLIPGVNTIDKDRSDAARDYGGSWERVVGKWREQLDAIGRGFAAGDARVDPKRGPMTCERCDQHTFCRIAEKGAFGVRKGEEGDE